jgi:hypothetical protein
MPWLRCASSRLNESFLDLPQAIDVFVAIDIFVPHIPKITHGRG